MGDHISTLSCSMRVPLNTTPLHLDIGHGISATLSYALLGHMPYEKNYPVCQSPCDLRLCGRGGNRTPIESDNAELIIILTLNKL